MLYIKYNNTCIYSKQIVSLDSGRLTTVVPLSAYIGFNNNVYKYKYFIKNSKEIILRDFLFNYEKGYDNSEEVYAMNRLNEIVVEFESDKEFEKFKNTYIKNIDVEENKRIWKKLFLCRRYRIRNKAQSNRNWIRILYKKKIY